MDQPRSLLLNHPDDSRVILTERIDADSGDEIEISLTVHVPHVRTVATVQNQGSKAARATCRITALDTSDTPEGAETVLTEQIPAGGTVTLRHEFADVTVPPASVSITCT